MCAQTLLIADSNEDFAQALIQSLPGEFQTTTCQNGAQTLELLRSSCPDVLLLDLMLPQLDGLTILRTAKAEQILPLVIVTSRILNDSICGMLQELGVLYAFMKPCKISATVERLVELSCYGAIRPPDSISQVGQILIQLGITPNLRGFSYLQPAVLQMYQDPALMITKDLYPSIASQFGITEKQVERSIRTAVEVAWKHRTESVWRQIFPLSWEKRPSNALFIAYLANAMCHRQSFQP